MRSSGNFSPEWGYLAPAPSFLRTARIVAVATAIGATAGAAVVLSLVDRPAADSSQASVAAHAIMTTVEAAPATGAPANDASVTSTAAPVNVTTAAPAPVASHAASPQPGAAHAPTETTPDMGKANSYPAPKPAVGMASLSEGPPANGAAPADGTYGATGTVPAAQQPNNAPKPSHTGTTYYSSRPPALGAMLRRLFSAHNGVSYFPNN